MKFYTRSGAPNPRRVDILLAEKGITPDWEVVEVDIFKDEHRSSEFIERNPFQRVPVLELEDGTSISESVAICRYFEELHPKVPLFGSTALEKAQIEMWNRHMEMNFLFMVASSFRHLHPRMAALEKPQIAEWGEVNKLRAQTALDIMNRQLANNSFIAGDNFSIADISASVGMEMLKLARIDLPENSSHLQRWWQQISERPAFAIT